MNHKYLISGLDKNNIQHQYASDDIAEAISVIVMMKGLAWRDIQCLRYNDETDTYEPYALE